MKYCIIVDGYSAGKQITRELRERGYLCVHVYSSANVQSRYKHEINLYHDNFIYRDNLADLLEEILLLDVKIECVMAGAESGVELADLLSDALKMAASNGVLQSVARRNKYEMRKALAAANLATPEFFESSILDEILTWIDNRMSYPVVAKPLNSAGTDGVAICHNQQELISAYDGIMKKTDVFGNKNEKILVETFLKGVEYVVNSVSCKGFHKLVDILVYRKTYNGKTFIYDREEVVDMNLPEYQPMIRYVHQVLDALGVKFGPSHAEVMLTDSGPVLVEVGARLGGGTHKESSQECLGINSVSLTVDSYLNQEAFFKAYHTQNKLLKHMMQIDFATQQEGIVESENISKQLASIPSVKSYVIKLKPGDRIVPTYDLVSSPVAIHLVHSDREQLLKDYELVQEICRDGFVIKLDKTSILNSASDNKFGFFNRDAETSMAPSHGQIVIGICN